MSELIPYSDLNPRLRLYITLRIRLLRIRDGSVLYDQCFVYSNPSEQGTYVEWSKDDAIPREASAGIQALARLAIEEVFLLAPLHRRPHE